MAKSIPLLDQKPVGQQGAFYKSKARCRVCQCGNRAGKSTAGARELVWRTLGIHPYHETKPPTTGWVVTCDRHMHTSILMPKVLEMAPAAMIKRVTYSDVPTIEWKNGSTTEFKSYQSGWKKFQAAAIDHCWFDEEPDEKIYDEVRMRCIDRKAPWWVTMTPVAGKTWFYRRILKPNLDGDLDSSQVEVFRWSTRDNTTLDPKEITDATRELPDHLRRMRIYGDCVDMTGLIWPQFNEEIHVIDSFDLQPHWPIIVGLDPGYDHPFGAVFMAVQDDGNLVVWYSYRARKLLAVQHAKKIVEIFKEFAPWKVDDQAVGRVFAAGRDLSSLTPDTERVIEARFVVDPTSVQVARELSAYGINPSPAIRDVDAGIQRVGTLLLDRSRGRPGISLMRGRNAPLIDELRTWSWAPCEDGAEPKPLKVGDDCCDGLRYGCMERPIGMPLPSDGPPEHSFAWHMNMRKAAEATRRLMGNEQFEVSQIQARLMVMGRSW